MAVNFTNMSLIRVGSDAEESPMKKAKGNGIELNARGIPARKRKKNSLIYGADDLVSISFLLSSSIMIVIFSQVSIPVKSPKKKVGGSPTKQPTPTSAREPEKFKYENNIRPKQEKFDDFYDDDDEDFDEDMDDEDNIGDNDKSVDFYNNAMPERVVKSVRSTPTKKKEIPELKVKTELEEEISMGNRLNAQRLGVALRNLLKLPKAHKWVCFEFFYSNIDKVLFQGENDFQVCLRESLPNLATRRLSRVEWAKVSTNRSRLRI